MADTHITDEHRRAFNALTNGQYRNFCLFSCSCDGHPAVAIAAVNVRPSGEEGGEDEYRVQPLFVSVTPSMKLTDHDGREA